MLAEVSTISAGLALAAALYAACAVFLSIRREDRRWAESGRNGIYAATGLLGLSTLLLLVAFLTDRFSIRYVAAHSNRELPIYLKVSAIWAGQEGSLLLWSFLQALFAALVLARPSDHSRPLVPWATVLLSLTTVFFIAMTLFLSNPFTQLAAPPADGQGLNPLLRHPGMVFHPPALYLGYVGLAVPFAFALAALITRQVESWPVAARRWTVVAWLFLAIGLLLGARWAYDVLGWGGYWGWDPVENAGLMPWLTATALLHGMAMQQHRRGFRWWNVSLAVLSFVLVLFGTFTTRSGMIVSVHAFARSALGPYFLALIGLVLAGSFALMIDRRRLLVDPRPAEGLLSRDGMFVLTMTLFLTITVSVLVGSLLPTLTEALTARRFEAGTEWFDRVAGPQFTALALVMGLCPLLGFAASTARGSSADPLRKLRQRWVPTAVSGVGAAAVAALAGFTLPLSLLGFAFAGMAGGTALVEIARDVAARHRREGSPLRALGDLLQRNQRKYGGYVVHIGVALMFLGLLGTRMYPFETEATLAPTESTTVRDYTLVLDGVAQEPAHDYLATRASLLVYRDGTYLTTLRPQVNQYMNYDQDVAIPSLRVGLREDLYLVLAGWNPNQSATFKVFINPLASFLWLGGLVFLAGGGLALWPQSRPTRLPAARRRRRAAGRIVAVVAVSLLLIGAAVAMWGTSPAAVGQPAGNSPAPAGRPRIGEAAPSFTLDLLDGTRLSLSDLHGEVAVINFWATWCPPCEDELPHLRSIWEEYRSRGVTVLGVAYREDAATVQQAMDEFELAYPMGIDNGERIALAYGITGVPETFVIDPQGQVAQIYIGPVTAEQLAGDLDRLLQP